MKSSFGDKLRYLREQKGFTQEALANLYGCSRSLINQYETGRKQPKLRNLKRLSQILNTSQDFLLDEDASILSAADIELMEKAAHSKERLQYEMVIGEAIEAKISPDEIRQCIELLINAKQRARS